MTLGKYAIRILRLRHSPDEQSGVLLHQEQQEALLKHSDSDILSLTNVLILTYCQLCHMATLCQPVALQNISSDTFIASRGGNQSAKLIKLVRKIDKVTFKGENGPFSGVGIPGLVCLREADEMGPSFFPQPLLFRISYKRSHFPKHERKVAVKL